MTDAREQVRAAAAMVAEPPYPVSLQPFHVVVVAPPWLGAEQAHDGPPFPSVWFDACPEQAQGHQMRGFMRHGCGEEILGMSLQQVEVVANQAEPANPDAHLARGRAT